MSGLKNYLNKFYKNCTVKFKNLRKTRFREYAKKVEQMEQAKIMEQMEHEWNTFWNTIFFITY